MFTESELRRLHRRFGHPSSEKLLNLLRRSELSDVDNDTRKMLDEIARRCHLCQMHAEKPRRFKFALRTDKQFNHTIYVDVLYIDRKPIFHVVDEATRYQAARWLPDVTAEAVRRAMKLCWIDVYVGPPDVIAHDAAKYFLASKFQTYADMMHITTNAIPVESANSMSFVERYHKPLKRAYKIMEKEAPSLDPESLLQGALKALNDSTGPDGLVPTLLVYGALPRLGLPIDKPSPTMYERAIAVRKATDEMSKHFASRQVRDALRMRNGPDITDIHSTPIGAHALVYRLHKDKWEGPYTLLDRQDENCTVLLPQPSGPTLFRSTVVKPYFASSPDGNHTTTLNDTTNVTTGTGNNEGGVEEGRAAENSLLGPAAYFSLVMPSDAATASSHSDLHNVAELEDFLQIVKCNTAAVAGNVRRFDSSRKKELLGLAEKGTFSIVPASTAEGHRIFGSRFVDTVKNEGTPDAFEKSRLVVQAFNDNKHGFLTHSPTVQRSSQRLLLAVHAMDPSLQIFTRDVTQAYTQSSTRINRPIFVRAPPELGLSDDKILQINSPFYGIPEAGVHWFTTYLKHHVEKLGMTSSSHDLCLLYTTDSQSSVRGITCLQTDDTLSAGNTKFMALEEKESKTFQSKPVTILTPGTSFKFNGGLLSKKEDGTLTLSQSHHAQKLNTIATASVSTDEYVSQRALGAYIAANCRPDLSFGFSFAAQATNPDKKDAQALNKVISECISTADIGLNYVSLDMDTLNFSIFVDASFANNRDYSSQLGFIAVLLDGSGNANVVHYASVKSKRITRSVLAAELYAMVLGFDHCSPIRITLQNILRRRVSLHLYTDSKCLFDGLTTLNTTTEKRLLIDLNMLRQCYERREIVDVFWMPGDQNPPDGLTKPNACKALRDLVQTNKLNITPNAWVEREPSAWARELSLNK